MNEKSKMEAGQAPENTEAQKYEALLAVLAEQERILKETEDVLNVPPEEREANAAKLKELGKQGDEASKNFGQALEEYMAAINEAHEQEKQE